MRITEHVDAIRIPFQVKLASGVLDRFVYAYLVRGREICLIDSGVVSSEDIIFAYLRGIGLSPAAVSKMVLTHSHPDHIGSAKSVKEASGCTVYAHPGERAWIEDVDLQARERPVPNFHTLVAGSVGVDFVLEDGAELDLGDAVSLKIIHTPGHSRGSLSLFLPQEGVLFTGDAIPVPGDLPIYEDFSASRQSIEKLKALQGVKKLLASWDDPKEADAAYDCMDQGLAYIGRIHEAVAAVAANNPALAPMDLCVQVLEVMGIPGGAANPIIAKSFQTHVAALMK